MQPREGERERVWEPMGKGCHFGPSTYGRRRSGRGRPPRGPSRRQSGRSRLLPREKRRERKRMGPSKINKDFIGPKASGAGPTVLVRVQRVANVLRPRGPGQQLRRARNGAARGRRSVAVEVVRPIQTSDLPAMFPVSAAHSRPSPFSMSFAYSIIKSLLP